MPSLPSHRTHRSGHRYPTGNDDVAQSMHSPHSPQRPQTRSQRSERGDTMMQTVPRAPVLGPSASPGFSPMTPFGLASPRFSLQSPQGAASARRPLQREGGFGQWIENEPPVNALGILTEHFEEEELPASAVSSARDLAQLREELRGQSWGSALRPAVRLLRFRGGDESREAQAGVALLHNLFEAMADRGPEEPFLQLAEVQEAIVAVTQAPYASLRLAQAALSLQGDTVDAVHEQRRMVRALTHCTLIGPAVAATLWNFLIPVSQSEFRDSRSLSFRVEVIEVLRRLLPLAAHERLELANYLQRAVYALTPHAEPLLGLTDLFEALSLCPAADRAELIVFLESHVFVSLGIAGRLVHALHRIPASQRAEVWQHARAHAARIEQFLSSEILRHHLQSRAALPVPVAYDADDERLAFVEVYSLVQQGSGASRDHAVAAFELAQRYGCFGAFREQFARLHAMSPTLLQRERARIANASTAAERMNHSPTPTSPRIWPGPIR